MALFQRNSLLVFFVISSFLLLWNGNYPKLIDAFDIKKVSPIADWVWLGALTSSSIRINVGLNTTASLRHNANIQILVESVHDDNDDIQIFSRKYLAIKEILLDPPIYYHKVKDGTMMENRIVHFHLRDLPYPKTKYRFQVQWHEAMTDNNEELITLKEGFFRSAEIEGDYWNFTFAFSSCMNSRSEGYVFDHMNMNNDNKPDIFVHLGDLHYDNINEHNITKYRWSMWNALARTDAGKSMLTTQIPMAYMYDDHDFNDNNCDKYAPGKHSALQTYREFVPHYPLSSITTNDNDNPIHQSFLLGDVLFILTDLQSQRSPENQKDDHQKSILGTQQKQWFRELLQESSKFSLIVWCSTTPWIDDERKWGNYATERDEIISMMQNYGLSNKFIIISGDAHMIAVDNGTYSYGHIPVFQAAALGRNGKIKGGPFSHGVFPGIGQYGTIQINHTLHGKVCLQFTGHRVLSKDDHMIVQTYNTCTQESLHPDSLYIPPPIYMRKLQRIVKRIKKAYKRFMKRNQKKYPALKSVEAVMSSVIFSMVLILSIIALTCRIFWNNLRHKKVKKKKD